MPLSVRVWTLPDRVLARSIHRGLNQLIREARRQGLPTLGNVDEYDETRFTRMQMSALIPELQSLVQSNISEVADAATELLALGEQERGGPHRYLVFIGD